MCIVVPEENGTTFTMMTFLERKGQSWGWGNSQVYEVLAMQTGGSESSPQYSCKKLDKVVCVPYIIPVLGGSGRLSGLPSELPAREQPCLKNRVDRTS